MARHATRRKTKRRSSARRGGNGNAPTKLYPPVGIGSPFTVKPSEETLRKIKAMNNARQEMKNRQAAQIRHSEATQADRERFQALQKRGYF